VFHPSRQTSTCSIDSGRCRPFCTAPSTVIDLKRPLPSQGCQLEVLGTRVELVHGKIISKRILLIFHALFLQRSLVMDTDLLFHVETCFETEQYTYHAA